jgi:hypothetical protein
LDLIEGFETTSNKKDAASYEFDLVIDRNFIARSECTAEIILSAQGRV